MAGLVGHRYQLAHGDAVCICQAVANFIFTMLQEELGNQMSEAIGWRRENGVTTPATPSMASYTDAMNKFTMSATAFMDHVHLLTEARDAHQMAITASASRRSSLDAGDRNQHYY